MPLEINEIGISMKVRDGEEDQRRSEKSSGNSVECCDDDRESIVDDCVMRVLQILRTLEER